MAGLDITPRPDAGQQLVTSYGNGGFRISGQRHAGSVIVFPARTIAWSATTIADITMAALTNVTQASETVRVLIIGCGRQFSTPPWALHEALMASGIALEWMDTGAACRTYNILTLEGREVAAALLAVD